MPSVFIDGDINCHFFPLTSRSVIVSLSQVSSRAETVLWKGNRFIIFSDGPGSDIKVVFDDLSRAMINDMKLGMDSVCRRERKCL